MRVGGGQPRALLALGPELHEARVRPLAQFGDRPELDRIRWTRLGAGRLEPDLHPVVAQRAFLRRSRGRVHVDHAEGAGGDAGAAAVAHVRLDDDRVELGANNRARGADLQAPRLDAVLANITHHQPAAVVRTVELLDELDVTPVCTVDLPPVVVPVARQL